MSTSLEVLGYLPRPPRVSTDCAAKMFNGELLAYGSASSVIVVDVASMVQATALVGGHQSAAVTALDWHPLDAAAESKAPMSLLLASGDTEGRVVVWDVLSGTPVASLEDAFYSGFGVTEGARRSDTMRAPVKALVWATARNLLAILLAPGYLLLWDYRSGSVVWRRDLGPSDAFNSLHTDPCDRRRIVLSTAVGAFATLRLDAPAAGKVKYQRFQAEISAGGLRCALPGTAELLLLVLARELIVFDLEYGHPAAVTKLPPGLPALDYVLGSFGYAVAGVAPQDPGIDCVYCCHVDGSVSAWQRREASLVFTLVQHVALASQALNKAAGISTSTTASSGAGQSSGGGSASAFGQILAVVAGARCGPLLEDSRGSGEVEPALDSLREDSSSIMDAEAPHPGRVRQLASPATTPRLSDQSGPSNPSFEGAGGAPTDAHSLNSSDAPAVAVVALSSDGDAWLWRFPLLRGTLPPRSAAPQLLQEARLLGSLHALSGMVSAFSALPAALSVNGCAAGALLAGTAAGTLELVAVRRGRLSTLHLDTSTCLVLHPAPVLGVRWLGASSRAVSYSSQRTAAGDWVNHLVLTDFRAGGSVALRDGAPERGPITGLRASPDGSYLLVIFRGLASEVWTTPEGSPPFRLRQVDLQFTSVEWVLRAEAGTEEPTAWVHDAPPADCSAASPPALEDLPEERLVFTLADGRIGVLSVQGRRINDTKPRMPSWPQLASGDFRATCASSWGPLVFLGGHNGTLVRWDTASGRTVAVDTTCGRIHGLVIAPLPNAGPPVSTTVVARLAVLASSGAFAVLSLDAGGQLHSTAATWAAGAAAVGRVVGIDWVPLPKPFGRGAALAVTTDSGALAIVEVTGRKHNLLSSGAEERSRGSAGHAIIPLAPPPKMGSAYLLPRPLRLLLRLLLQRGAPTALLRRAGAAKAPRHVMEKVDAELWAWLPPSAAVDYAAKHSLPTSPLLSPNEYSTDQSTPKGAAGMTDTLATLLEQNAEASRAEEAAGGGGGHSPVKRSVEEAAAKLGYRQPAGRGAQTFKSLGGAVKDLASVGKDQLRQTLAGRGGGGMEGGESPSPAGMQAPGRLSAVGIVPGGYSERVVPSSVASKGRGTADACGALAAALAACTEARGLAGPLTNAELNFYDAALTAGSTSRRMEVAAGIGGSPEEVTFWQRLPGTLRLLKGGDSAVPSLEPTSGVLWCVAGERAAAAERSGWHGQMGRRVFESSEALQEKRALELLSLGDLHAAVGFLLASPPGRSARFYRDSLCALGMAFACGLHQHDAGEETASSESSRVVDAAARTLFVQAAKVTSANAAAAGDVLLGVPLLCATGEFDDAVNILQDAGMWGNAAALAAGSLNPAARVAPLERWATHVADAEGRLWGAAGLLVGAGLLGEAAELLALGGLADGGAAILAAAVEAGWEIGGEEGMSGDAEGGAAASLKVGGTVDGQTSAVVEQAYDSYVRQVMRCL